MPYKFAPNPEVVESAWLLRPPTGSPKPDEVPRARATAKRVLIIMIFESWLFLAFFHSCFDVFCLNGVVADF